jgi:putative MATE family efflux protein
MRDMTKGSVARNIAVFSAPLVLDNMFQQLYGVVNSVVAGRCLGSAALAATGTAIPVMNIATFLLCGMTLGAAVLMAEFFGARRLDMLKRECGTAFSVGVVFTLLLSAAGIACLKPALALIKAPPEIAPQAAAYLKIIFAGLLFSFLYNFFSSSLRAVGESAVPLYFLVAASLLNLGLAVLFVGRMGLGIRGAALATVISQAAAALMCFLYIYFKTPALRLELRSLRPDRMLLARTVSYSSVSGVQQTVLYVGVFLLQGAVNPLGVTAIAAFNGVCRIDGFVMAFGDSLATALMMFISQNLGAGRGDRALKGLSGTLLLNLAVTGSLIVSAAGRAARPHVGVSQ